jgi:hypothetical protein
MTKRVMIQMPISQGMREVFDLRPDIACERFTDLSEDNLVRHIGDYEAAILGAAPFTPRIIEQAKRPELAAMKPTAFVVNFDGKLNPAHVITSVAGPGLKHNIYPVRTDAEAMGEAGHVMLGFDADERGVRKMPQHYGSKVVWGARYPHHDTTSAWEAIDMLTQANVPDTYMARMLGGDAAQQFGVARVQTVGA